MIILVIGDTMIDRYWMGKSTRNNPDGPQPLVSIDSRMDRPGGAGNLAENFLALGATTFVPEGRGARSVKNRVVSGNRVVLRFDEDVRHRPLTESYDLRCIEKLHDWDAVVVADYAKGSVDDAVAAWVRRLGKPTYVDCKVGAERWADWAECMFPNLGEYERHADVYDACACALMIKKGPLGCTYREKPSASLNHRSFPSVVRNVVNPTGAGDTAMAAFVFAKLSGTSSSEACEFAMAAAAAAVEAPLTYGPTLAEIASNFGNIFAARQVKSGVAT